MAPLVAKTAMRSHTLDAMLAQIPRCAALVAPPAPEGGGRHDRSPVRAAEFAARQTVGELSDAPHQWLRRPAPRAGDRLPARSFLQRGPVPSAARQSSPGVRDAR